MLMNADLYDSCIDSQGVYNMENALYSAISLIERCTTIEESRIGTFLPQILFLLLIDNGRIPLPYFTRTASWRMECHVGQHSKERPRKRKRCENPTRCDISHPQAFQGGHSGC